MDDKTKANDEKHLWETWHCFCKEQWGKPKKVKVVEFIYELSAGERKEKKKKKNKQI